MAQSLVEEKDRLQQAKTQYEALSSSAGKVLAAVEGVKGGVKFVG